LIRSEKTPRKEIFKLEDFLPPIWVRTRHFALLIRQEFTKKVKDFFGFYYMGVG